MVVVRQEGTLNMCCGNKATPSKYNIEVTFRDGSKRIFASKVEARIAIAGNGGGGTMKAVPKDANPVTK